MYNYDQRQPSYGQPIEFLYARGLQPGVNMQPGIGPFVNGVRSTMNNINGMPDPYMVQPPPPQIHQPPMHPQIMHVDQGIHASIIASGHGLCIKGYFVCSFLR